MKTKRLLILLSLTLVLVACKKGKDDPALSLRSRNHRLVGTWKLMSGTVNQQLANLNQTNTYTDTEETITGNLNPGTSGTSPFSFFVKIRPDGSFEYGTESYTSQDGWHWLDGTKSKTGVYLPLRSLINAQPCDFNFSLDRLTMTEMNLSLSEKYYYNPAYLGLEVSLKFRKSS